MKKHSFKKAISVCCLIGMLLFNVNFHVIAADDILYETENNNTQSTADITYDGYGCYGALSSTTDIDWWKYTATFTGFANIWLGNIPSGKDYDIFIYLSNGTLMAKSIQGNTTSEIMKCRLKSGNTYYVRISSPSGHYSTSNYKLSIKNYTLGNARMFVFNARDINTVPCAQPSYTHLYGMGYADQWYLNNSVSAAYSVLPTSRVFVVRDHADAGRMFFDTSATVRTTLYANQPSGMSSSDRALSNAGDLSNVALTIFLGCNSGNTSSTYGNLVDVARTKGVQCALGWKNSTYTASANDWTVEFFAQCSLNKNVYSAAEAADEYTKKYNFDFYDGLKNRYFGSSRLDSVVI